MNTYDTIYGMIRKVIKEETKYSVPRIGIVLNTKDPKAKGRIQVSIPIFNWTTKENSPWCFPIDKNSLITPAVDDFVLVQWIDGDINKPVYSGIATEMLNMLPEAYDNQESTQVIFQSNDNILDNINYDEKTGTITIKVSGNIQLETTDSSLWQPCIISNCLFSGAPHGGSVAGLIKLKGA